MQELSPFPCRDCGGEVRLIRSQNKKRRQSCHACRAAYSREMRQKEKAYAEIKAGLSKLKEVAVMQKRLKESAELAKNWAGRIDGWDVVKER